MPWLLLLLLAITLTGFVVVSIRLGQVLAELRQLRFDIRSELNTGGQHTAAATIIGELGEIAAKLGEMQSQQTQGQTEQSD